MVVQVTPKPSVKGCDVTKNGEISHNITSQKGKFFLNGIDFLFPEGSEKLLEDDKEIQNKRDEDYKQVEEVVHGLGLAYYFVPLEEEKTERIDPEHKIVIDAIKSDSKIKERLQEIQFNIKDVEKVFARFGIPSEQLEQLHQYADESAKITLNDLLSFLKGITSNNSNGHLLPQQCNLPLVSGSIINESFKPLNFQETGYVITVPEDKLFSLQDLEKLIKSSATDIVDKSEQGLDRLILNGDSNAIKYNAEIKLASQYVQKNVETNGLALPFSDVDNQVNTYLLEQASEVDEPNMGEFIKSGVSKDSHSGSDMSHFTALRASKGVYLGSQSDGGMLYRDGQHQNLLSQDNMFQSTFFGLSGAETAKTNTAGLPLSLSYTDTWVPQMSSYLQKAMSEGRNQLVLQLEPPELGYLVVRLKSHGNRITAHISTSNDFVKGMLHQSQTLLERSLNEQGLVLDGFTVDVQSDGYSESDRTLTKEDSNEASGSRFSREDKKKVQLWDNGHIQVMENRQGYGTIHLFA